MTQPRTQRKAPAPQIGAEGYYHLPDAMLVGGYAVKPDKDIPGNYVVEWKMRATIGGEEALKALKQKGPRDWMVVLADRRPVADGKMGLVNPQTGDVLAEIAPTDGQLAMDVD